MRATISMAAVLVFAMGCGGSEPSSGSAASATSGSAATGSSGSSSSGSTGSSSASGSSGSTSSSGSGSTSSSSGSSGSDLVTARPYIAVAPATYDASEPLPLVVLLHGYSSSAAETGGYLGLSDLADSLHFFYAAPDGTVDSLGNRFWNATAACCNFDGSSVDDVAYLGAVVADMQSKYPVDARRIYFIGHSNGAFMAQRMACERADRIAAVVSVAGAQNDDVSRCTPSEPVPMVEVHGDADDTIEYGGGDILGNAYPSAPTTSLDWATLDGCDLSPVDDDTTLDLDADVDGGETSVRRYTGCARGDVELWTMHGVGHVPAISPSFDATILNFLFANSKPQ